MSNKPTPISEAGEKPVVAILGRPNVGKSALFNRLTGRRHSSVADTPGVTRDRREGAGRLGDLEFNIVDTAGLDEGPRGSLPARMRAQTEAAVLQQGARELGIESMICLQTVVERRATSPRPLRN